jgi:hypothetical protein
LVVCDEYPAKPAREETTALSRFVRRPFVNAVLTGVGALCAVVVVAYAVLVLVEMFNANNSPSVLPPPTDRRIVVGIALVAIVVACFVATRILVDGETEPRPWSTIATSVAVAIALILFGASKLREDQYLSDVSRYVPNTATETVLKADGHQACDWLRGRHWGAPPDLPGKALSNNFVEVGEPTSNVIRSTRRLFVFYSRYLDKQHPGPLTPDDQLKRQVTLWAWFRMCPFQQWVHRPVGGAGD